MVLDDEEIDNIFNTFFRKYKIDRDDYYDVAAIGLVKALNAFDSNRNVKFSTYAIACMKSEVFTEYRKKNQIKRTSGQPLISLDAELTPDGFKLEDTLVDGSLVNDLISELNAESALSAIKNVLTPRDYKILCMKLLGFRCDEIAKSLDIPVKDVTAIQRNFKYNTKIIEICYYHGITKKGCFIYGQRLY